MRRLGLLAFLMVTATGRSLAMQECAHPVLEASPQLLLDTLPLAPSAVREAVTAALRRRGYRIAERTDSTVVTAPRTEWPTLRLPLDAHLLDHQHPGVVIRAAWLAVGDSTWLDIVFQAVCGVAPGDLQHRHARIDSVATMAALFDVQGALFEELRPVRGPPAAPPGDRRPEVESCPGPSIADPTAGVYPGDSVVLQFVIDATGRIEPGSIAVASASGGPNAVIAARQFAMRCRFRPAMVGGMPVRAVAMLPVRFGASPRREPPRH